MKAFRNLEIVANILEEQFLMPFAAVIRAGDMPSRGFTVDPKLN